MNQSPSGDADDDMEGRFRRGLKEDSGPSETVRRAILEHARRMAVEHADRQPGRRAPAVLATRRRRSIFFGTLAAAVFAGLLVVPMLRPPVVPEPSPVALPPAAPQAPALEFGEVERNETTDSAAGAQRMITADALKPKEAAQPTSDSSNYASQAKTAAPTIAGAAAAPPAAPAGVHAAATDAASAISAAPASANRNLARVAALSVERGALLRGAAAAGDATAVNALLDS